VMNGDGTLRRSERARARERVEYTESSMECDTQSDSDEEKIASHYPMDSNCVRRTLGTSPIARIVIGAM
jgi:hypothetical protein